MTTVEPPSRITWRAKGWTTQIGEVNGVDLFVLEHPGQWSPCFTLASPLIPCGPRSGPIGSVEFPYPPSAPIEGKATRGKIRTTFATDQERYRAGLADVHAAAEVLLREFARSILGLDAPTQDG